MHAYSEHDPAAEAVEPLPIIRPEVQVVAAADGCRLAVYVYEGEHADPSLTPVLMLHGNGGDHGSFWQIANTVAQTRKVIAPDMRSQGISEPGEARLTYELLADDALRVLDALGIERALVHGYSDGGIEALLLARDHPERVAGIVTMGANLTPEGVYETPDFDMAADEALFLTVADELPRARERANLLRLMIDEPHIDAESLSSISCPATIMAGEFDVIRPEETTLIARSVPCSRLVIVPEAGHSLMREAPAAVEAEVLDILKVIDGEVDTGKGTNG